MCPFPYVTSFHPTAKEFLRYILQTCSFHDYCIQTPQKLPCRHRKINFVKLNVYARKFEQLWPERFLNIPKRSCILNPSFRTHSANFFLKSKQFDFSVSCKNLSLARFVSETHTQKQRMHSSTFLDLRKVQKVSGVIRTH